MMRRLKAVVSYDGTAYHGFQRQGRGLLTVQDVLYQAIEAVTGEAVRGFSAAGRTDAGAHALGQVIAFDVRGSVPTERAAEALNTRLPGDVSIVRVEEVPAAFHPRFDAVAKEYVYTMHGFGGAPRQALLARWSLALAGPLDTGAMDDAARSLVGRFDCSAFQDVGRPVEDATRSIFACRVETATFDDPPFTGIPVARLVVRADGFLHHMVRVMAGTLVQVGRSRINAAALAEVVAGRDRKQAGPTLPAHGLCLLRVDYPGLG